MADGGRIERDPTDWMEVRTDWMRKLGGRGVEKWERL
jgi:hypothetical protein